MRADVFITSKNKYLRANSRRYQAEQNAEVFSPNRVRASCASWPSSKSACHPRTRVRRQRKRKPYLRRIV